MNIRLFQFQLLNVLLLAFWVWVIIDCARHKFDKDSEKTLWMLLVIFVPVLGSLAYLLHIKFKILV